MNRLETALMNNPIRALAQRKEAKRLRKYSMLPAGKHMLEIGCGNGYGAKIVRKLFQPQSLHAIDLDTKMIALAKKRSVPNTTFAVGDASKLPFKAKSFDAVIDFGIIHHIPNWKDCLSELHRVLKPGGELLIEDLSTESFEGFIGAIMKKTLVHPYDDMFSYHELIHHLKKIGFEISTSKKYSFPVKHFIVVATKR